MTVVISSFSFPPSKKGQALEHFSVFLLRFSEFDEEETLLALFPPLPSLPYERDRE